MQNNKENVSDKNALFHSFFRRAKSLLELVDPAAKIFIFKIDVIGPVTDGLSMNIIATGEEGVGQLEKELDFIPYFLKYQIDT